MSTSSARLFITIDLRSSNSTYLVEFCWKKCPLPQNFWFFLSAQFFWSEIQQSIWSEPVQTKSRMHRINRKWCFCECFGFSLDFTRREFPGVNFIQPNLMSCRPLSRKTAIFFRCQADNHLDHHLIACVAKTVCDGTSFGKNPQNTHTHFRLCNRDFRWHKTTRWALHVSPA